MKTFIQHTHTLCRWAIATTLSMMFLLGKATPAMALGSNPSDITDGTTQLEKVEQRSEEVLQEGPRGMTEIQSRAEGGLNGVQGAADRSKMNTPENSTDSETIIDSIKEAISDLTE